MASGFGAHGGVGRCYPFWQDFSNCVKNCEDPSHCMNQKEVTLPRVRALPSAFGRGEAAAAALRRAGLCHAPGPAAQGLAVSTDRSCVGARSVPLACPAPLGCAAARSAGMSHPSSWGEENPGWCQRSAGCCARVSVRVHTSCAAGEGAVEVALSVPRLPVLIPPRRRHRNLAPDGL